MTPEPLPVDRARLVWGKTSVPNLIEFARADCFYCQGDLCTGCIVLASRAQLEVALYAAQSHDVRLGDVWVNESDIRLLLTELDRYDRERRES